MVEYYDDLETRDPEDRENRLFATLRERLTRAKADAAYFRALLADIEPAAVTGRAALAALPVTRKSQLIDLQRSAPPLAGMTTVAPGALARLYQSPGPIYDAEGRRADYWRFARALHAAGFRRGDIVHNCFSYHLTPGGWMVDGGAQELGCAVFPAGVGNTESQVRAIADIRPTGYAGTPSFLKALLDKAAEMGLNAASMRKALVSGEALPPALRSELRSRGVDMLQCYGSADLGLIAYESPAQAGMILDEAVIVEIVRPGTGDPVAEGEVGEVVVTCLAPEYPLLRFATGDLSAMLPGRSPCGRTNARIKGWMGRADQTTKVRGMFVHPQQVAEVVRRHPEIAKARLMVTRDAANDIMVLRCETAGETGGLQAAVADSIQAVMKLKGGVELLAPGSLPNDGKVIEDARPL